MTVKEYLNNEFDRVSKEIKVLNQEVDILNAQARKKIDKTNELLEYIDEIANAFATLGYEDE